MYETLDERISKYRTKSEEARKKMDANVIHGKIEKKRYTNKAGEVTPTGRIILDKLSKEYEALAEQVKTNELQIEIYKDTRLTLERQTENNSTMEFIAPMISTVSTLTEKKNPIAAAKVTMQKLSKMRAGDKARSEIISMVHDDMKEYQRDIIDNESESSLYDDSKKAMTTLYDEDESDTVIQVQSSLLAMPTHQSKQKTKNGSVYVLSSGADMDDELA